MRTDTEARRGFTLVELLVVIAIIGILAGMTLAGVSRYMQTARMGRLQATFSNLNTLLTDYYAANDTFPPAYGYVNFEMRDTPIDCPPDADPSNDVTALEDPSCLDPDDPAHYSLLSYMDYLGQMNNFDLYDPFTEQTGYDTNADNYIDDMEYSPQKTDGTSEIDSLGNVLGLFDSTDPLSRTEAFKSAMILNSPRPLLYFPVNRRQAERVAKEWFEYADDNQNNDDNFWNDNPRPENFFDVTANDSILELLSEGRPLGDVDDAGDADFPPTKYDAFVLMSIGPNLDTYGFLREMPLVIDNENPQMIDFINGAYAPELRYHIFAMLVYIMASRDANQNGKLDFDFIARKGEEGSELFDSDGDTIPDKKLNMLFDMKNLDGPGPVIFVSE